MIHKDYVNLIHQWLLSRLLERKGRNSTQPFTKLPSESVLTNLNVNMVDIVETDVWINRWVKNDTLKAKLRHIAAALTKETDLSYYTDGSLSQDKTRILNGQIIPSQTHMGATFILQHDISLRCCAQIIHWPSSTRAELAAIFMALLTAPLYSNVKISTDSAMAIQSITKGKGPFYQEMAENTKQPLDYEYNSAD